MTLYFESFMPFFCGGDRVTVECLPLHRRFSFLFFFFFFFVRLVRADREKNFLVLAVYKSLIVIIFVRPLDDLYEKMEGF